jgi:NAD(P)-dependent dehydrogenase (short-subunit alcohol dehydrogenase family)
MTFTYLITGASGGIGNFLFERMLGRGHRVFGTCHSRRPDRDNLSKVDVSDHASVSAWVSSLADIGTFSESPKIVLINSAGITYNAFAHKADPNQWRRVIDVNLCGSFNVINCLLPHMREANFGRVINLSSVVAQKGVPGTSAYASSKAALWGLTKSIAAENASKGITVNSINIGYTDLGMIREVPEKLQEHIVKQIPLGKFGNGNNIASTIDFLIENDYVTGTNIDVSGGLV